MNGPDPTAVQTVAFLDLEATGLASTALPRTRITELSIVALPVDEFKALHRELYHSLAGVFDQSSMGVDGIRPLPDAAAAMAASMASPRVTNKLTLCFNPLTHVNNVVADLTGLDNACLDSQPAFSARTVRTVAAFVDRLAKPVAIFAHNGSAYDFPLLKAEVRSACVASESEAATDPLAHTDVRWADSLAMFRRMRASEPVAAGRFRSAPIHRLSVVAPPPARAIDARLAEVASTELSPVPRVGRKSEMNGVALPFSSPLTPPPSAAKESTTVNKNSGSSRADDSPSSRPAGASRACQRIDFGSPTPDQQAVATSNTATPSIVDSPASRISPVDNETTPRKATDHDGDGGGVSSDDNNSNNASHRVKPPMAPRKRPRPKRAACGGAVAASATGATSTAATASESSSATLSTVRRRLTFTEHASPSQQSHNSLKLDALHASLFGRSGGFDLHHSAEADCLALMRVCAAEAPAVLRYAADRANSQTFADVQPMW